VFLVTVLVGVLLFLRKPDAFLRPQLRAEDAVVFFIDAYEQGPKCILEPFSGYLNLLPRLVACAALSFDPGWTPAIYCLAAVLAELAVAAALFSPRIDLPAKPFLALALVLAPHTGEVLVNIANMQWPLAMALVLVLVARDPETALQGVADGLAVCVAGLTGPFIAFLAPLFLARAALRRSRSSVALGLLAGAIAGIQLFFVIRERTTFERPEPAEPFALLSILSSRLFGTFWGGYNPGDFSTTIAWGALGIVVTAMSAWLAFRRGPWAESRRMLAGAWVCLVASVGMKFIREPFPLRAAINGDRYFFLPHVILAWLLIVECARRRGWQRVLAMTPLAAALIANGRSFRVGPMTDYAWARQVPVIREGKPFSIPINPDGWVLVSRGRNSRR